MSNGKRDGTLFDSITFQKAARYISCSLMPFYYCGFHDVHLRIPDKFPVFIQLNIRRLFLCHNTAGKDADDMDMP